MAKQTIASLTAEIIALTARIEILEAAAKQKEAQSEKKKVEAEKEEEPHLGPWAENLTMSAKKELLALVVDGKLMRRGRYVDYVPAIGEENGITRLQKDLKEAGVISFAHKNGKQSYLRWYYAK